MCASNHGERKGSIEKSGDAFHPKPLSYHYKTEDMKLFPMKCYKFKRILHKTWDPDSNQCCILKPHTMQYKNIVINYRLLQHYEHLVTVSESYSNRGKVFAPSAKAHKNN